MLSLRITLLSIALLAVAGAPLAAQTPSSIIVIRLTEYNQSSATQQSVTGYDFAAYVSFATTPPSGTTVALQGPSGAPVQLTPQTDGTYQLIVQQPSASSLAALYPDGRYTISVGGNGANTSTAVTVNTNATVSPTQITNFDQLQALPSNSATVQWSNINNTSGDDILSFTMTAPDGSDIPASDPASVFSLSVAEIIPLDVKVTADLTYAKLVTTSQLNSGATNFASGIGFNVEFPIYYPPPPPAITQQPTDAASAAGGSALLSVNAIYAKYQWYHNGVAIPGAIGSSYYAGGTVTDAGTYTVVVSNGVGSVTSNPVTLSVGTGLNVVAFAGTGTAGSADGPGASAQFNEPAGMAFDRNGNLYVADAGNATIRKISPAGLVSTFAGQAGQTGSADGVGAAARFNRPWAIAIGGDGMMYVCDVAGETIRKIAPDGTVSTFAGTAGQGGDVDATGAAARFNGPVGIAVDGLGNVYVCDWGNALLRKISPAGVVSTVMKYSGAGAAIADPLALGPDGNLYIASSALFRLALDHPGAPLVKVSDPAFPFIYPLAMVGDANGNWYVSFNGQIQEVTPDGMVTTVAGSSTYGYGLTDGFGVRAQLGQSDGMAIDASGVLYIADFDHNVIRKATIVPGTGSGISFVEQTQAHVMPAGSTIAIGATASGGAITQGTWEKDGVAISASSYSPLIIRGAKASDAGTYTFVATNAAGAARSATTTVTIDPNAVPSRIMNLSIRSSAGTGAQTLIVGFAVAGSGTTKSVLLRGIGPGLVPYGVTVPVPDPVLTIFQGQTAIQSNDDWAPSLAGDFQSVGAFPLTTGSTDAALKTSFAPGSYSAQITGKSATGIALAEIYDLENANSGLRLVNVSARTQVGTGDNVLIAGFAITGATARTVLLRGVGPTLFHYGVTGYLNDPQIELYSGTTRLAFNDNWVDGLLSTVESGVGAFALDSMSKDAAMVTTLDPGTYSVVVRGVNNTTGVALVEVYEVP